MFRSSSSAEIDWNTIRRKRNFGRNSAGICILVLKLEYCHGERDGKAVVGGPVSRKGHCGFRLDMKTISINCQPFIRE